MNKEPIGLYLFRYVVGIGILFFMLMLNWSNNLIEHDLKKISRELQQIKTELDLIQSDARESDRDLLNALYTARPASQITTVNNSEHLEKTHTASLEDPQYPNLMSEDPFYTSTLNKILPKNFTIQGTRRSAVVSKPDNLHPFNNLVSVSSLYNRCRSSVAQLKFGQYETMSPDMATKIEARPSKVAGVPEYWVHLRHDMNWEPLQPNFFPDDFVLAPHFLKQHPVTAHDFKFFFDALSNPHVEESGAAALRTLYGELKEIEVVDDYTFIVRWQDEKVVDPETGSPTNKVKYKALQLTGGLTPLASWVYQYFPDGSKIIDEEFGSDSYKKSTVWAQNFSRHWAKQVIPSCGPWIFNGITDRQIHFIRNPNFHQKNAVLVKDWIVYIKETPDAIWQDFKIGKIDTYNLRPDQVNEYETFINSDEYKEQEGQGFGIQRIDYISRVYNYIGWNITNPLFQSKEIRRAMTMAIDRDRIIENNLNNMAVAITGPFFIYSPSYNSSIKATPYDPTHALQILSENGWYDSDGDGLLDKEINGNKVPFQFSITYFVKNPTSKANCEYIATALREIGIDCQLNGVDSGDLSSTFEEKTFDALYLGWALGTPPEDPWQLWHSEGAEEKGSSNAVGFVNLEADRIIESLQYEYIKKERLGKYHRFHSIIHEENPYTFLYTPKTTMLYRNYVKNVFLPADRQDLIPGANIAEPISSIFWLDQSEK